MYLTSWMFKITIPAESVIEFLRIKKQEIRNNNKEKHGHCSINANIHTTIW